MPLNATVDDIPEEILYDLHEFVEAAHALLQRKRFIVDDSGEHLTVDDFEYDQVRADRRFASFVLTGIHPDSKKQAYITLDSYRGTSYEDELDVFQDFDSFIGLSQTLPYRKSIGLKVWPEPRDTLKKGVKISVMVLREEREQRVPLQYIPNFGFGSCANRHTIRLFLPALYDGTTHAVTFDYHWPKLVYDNCTYPALRDVLPERLCHFPTSYKAESFRATRKNGSAVHSLFDIPVHRLEEFCEAFMRLLRAHPFGRDAFFMHEVRGVKGQGHFKQGDVSEAQVFENVSGILDLDSVQESIQAEEAELFIDVGYEVGVDGYVSLIRKDAHADILREFFDFPIDVARRKANDTQNFSSDATAHLTHAAGLQFISTPNNPHGIRFLNVYCTEKSPTYLIDKGRYAKFIQPFEIIEHRLKNVRSLEHMENMQNIFIEAINSSYYPARFEPRLPIANARNIMLSQEFLKSVIYLIPTEVWWTFKALRQRALLIMANLVLSSPRGTIAKPEVLTFITILTYMSNALCSKPEMGDKFECIRWSALRHDMEDDTEIAVCPYGLFFIREIGYYNHCPHLAHGRIIYPEPLARLYGKSSLDSIKEMLAPVLPRQRPMKTVHPAYISNKRAKTETIGVNTFREDEEIDIEAHGIELPNIGSSSDVPRHLAIEGYENHQETSNERFTRLWHQFISDMSQKFWTPKDRSETPYMKRRENIDESFFKQPDLSQCFNVVGFHATSWSQWKTNFDHMFPPAGQPNPERNGTQNFFTMQYFNAYIAMKGVFESNGEEGINEFKVIRELLMEKYNAFRWVPYAEKARMFFTAKGKRGKRDRDVFPRHHTGAAPVVLLNPRYESEIHRILDNQNDAMDYVW